MARITLFRHAKAEYPLAGKDDYNRTLAPRGLRNADRMGRFIIENNLIPDLVIVSGAARTRETYDRASVHWPSLPTIFTDSIYEASATTILTAIEAHGGDLQNVMVIGHNPGLAVLLHHLVDSSIAHTDLSHFPTSCVADIVFDAPSISEIDIEAGRLCSFMRVRELRD
jgi:phosphohistidine phosphatase